LLFLPVLLIEKFSKSCRVFYLGLDGYFVRLSFGNNGKSTVQDSEIFRRFLQFLCREIKIGEIKMIQIGPRRYRCVAGEEVTIRFSPNPEDCIVRIKFAFDRDASAGETVVNNEITFTFNEPTELGIMFEFDPAQVDGICNLTLSGSGNENFPDITNFAQIPPHRLYHFVI
jgi:hypothetical protein